VDLQGSFVRERSLAVSALVGHDLLDDIMDTMCAFGAPQQPGKKNWVTWMNRSSSGAAIIRRTTSHREVM
jgi:hypothetical protein